MNKKHYFLIVLAIVVLYYLIYLLGTIKVTAQFEDLEPFRYNLPIYYKGFKLGHTTKIYPGPDYQTTRVDMRIKEKGIALPANTTALLRRKDKKDYIELMYPKEPYVENLKYNSIIDGTIGVNFEHYIQEQASNGGLDEIKNNVNTTIKSAGETFEALTEMLWVLTGILEDVRPSINSATQNLEISSKNLADISKSLKTSVDKGYIDNALYNFQETSGNLVLTTKNFGGFSDNLNKQSSILLNCLLEKLNTLASNINQIVVGIGETLKKRFGGLRLFLGKMN